MKRITLEVLLLAVISTFVGFLWNGFSPRGISLGHEIVSTKPGLIPVTTVSPTGGNGSGLTPTSMSADPQPDPNRVLTGADWTGDDVIYISLKTALEYYNDEIAVFVDARKPSEYEAGHIPNAINLFHDRSDRLIENVRDELLAVPYRMVYCGGGDCEMSRDLAHDLTKDYGIEEGTVFVYAGGFNVWEFNQLPVVKGSERGARVPIQFPADPKLPPAGH